MSEEQYIISPQQAFEAAKVLWPSCKKIDRVGVDGWVIDSGTGIPSKASVLWPENTKSWPVIETKWIPANPNSFPYEYGRKARFYDKKDYEFPNCVDIKDPYYSTVCGCVPSIENGKYKWISENGVSWKYCDIAVTEDDVPPKSFQIGDKVTVTQIDKWYGWNKSMDYTVGRCGSIETFEAIYDPETRVAYTCARVAFTNGDNLLYRLHILKKQEY